MKTKVLLIALLAQLLSLTASAYDAYVGGIYYDLDTNNKTAKVTYKPQEGHYNDYSYYSGRITIPTNITYDNVNYRVTAIGPRSFAKCESLNSVTIPSSVNIIHNEAFENCDGLTSVIVPSTVTYIGEEAFKGCTGLTSFNTNAEFIGRSAFSGCSILTSINLSTSLSIIEDNAFEGTPWYESWYASQSAGPCYINNILYTYKGVMPANTSVNVREGTTCIAGGAFSGCTNLVSISIPQSVTSIGTEAFAGSGLKSISLPSSLYYFGHGVFKNCLNIEAIQLPTHIESSSAYYYYDTSDGKRLYFPGILTDRGFNSPVMFTCAGCTNLRSVMIPEGRTRISRGEFADCFNLTNITLPSTITSIYSSSSIGYPFKNCNNLIIVRANMQTPPTISSEVFTNRFAATLIVPNGCKEAYKNAEYWKDFKEIKEESEVEPDPVPAPTPDTDISQLDNVVYLEKIESNAGQEVTLPFQMKNSAAIRGFQFDLYLPDGVTAVKNAKGRIQGALSSGRLPEDDEHTLTIQEQPDGAIRFLCNSLYDETFTGSDGEIATLQVKIADNLEDGDYPIVIKNMKLTETNISNFYETGYLKSTLSITSYMLGDVNSDTMIDILDYTGVANHIVGIAQDVFVEKAADVDNSGQIDVADYTGIANLIMTGNVYGTSSNVKPESGRRKAADYGDNYIFVEEKELSIEDAPGTEVELSVCMKNMAPIRGFQFDMFLPEGFTAVKNAKGRITASLTSARLPDDDEHTLTVQEQADGAIRFLCSSLYDETFTGTDGEIATVKVRIAENIAAGNYKILLRNMKLTETNISNYYEADNVESVIKLTGGAEPDKCAKPTISYAGGKLTFTCETEGAICQSTITDTDIASYSSNEVQLGVTYRISVYATRDGYADSDVATATLCWIDAEPRTEGLDGDAVTEVKALPVLIQTQGGTISVRGIDDGMEVSAYGIDGKKEGSAISEAGQAVINTNLTLGSTAVVKIGERAVKVLMK